MGVTFMVGEPEIALGVLQIANRNRDGIATFDQAYAEIPDLVTLDAGNLLPSVTRPGEPMWYQIVRNIVSHRETEGNFIYEGYLQHIPHDGYKILEDGKSYLRDRGLA
jgi:hypothetical protein